MRNKGNLIKNKGYVLRHITLVILAVFATQAGILFTACSSTRNNTPLISSYTGDYVVSIVVVADSDYNCQKRLTDISFQGELFESIYHEAYINTVLVNDKPGVLEEFLPSVQPGNLDDAQKHELYTNRMTQILNRLGNGNLYAPGAKEPDTGSLMKAISVAAASLNQTQCNHKTIIVLDCRSRSAGQSGSGSGYLAEYSSGEMVKNLTTSESAPDLSGITVHWYD